MIIISPYSKLLPEGKTNPKNYPYWKDLVKLINEPIVQVGLDHEEKIVDDFRPNLSLEKLTDLVLECKTWISVDSFFQHFCWDLGKPGIVLWGQSDPLIFGHLENTNLLKSRNYLLEKQFFLWSEVKYRYDCWVPPQEIVKHLAKF